EAQALAKLSHPNVIVVYDVGSIDDEVFLAMEYVPGQSLLQWQLRRQSWRAALDLYLQAGRGLACAHAAGIVHRDFKPSNALVGTDGRVRVVDFGLARSEVADADGQVVGTPAYMAPEQVAGAADARSAPFSFCAALTH